MAGSRTTRPSKPISPDQSGDNRLFVLAVVAIAVIGLGVVAVLATSRDDGEAAVKSAEQTAPVELIGEGLLPLPNGVNVGDSSNDPVFGTAAPTLIGTGFDGEEITIEADGNPKAVYFLAHWCPHCQAELPMIQSLIANGSKPDDLRIYGVSTSVDRGNGNFPPQDWFEVEGFAEPVIRDDGVSSAIAGFGGNGFPYTVYLDGENRVVARTSGNVDAATTQELWQLTATAG